MCLCVWDDPLGFVAQAARALTLDVDYGCPGCAMDSLRMGGR